MLLLVLILVLIAFALLVVALLSGSVLSAWLAVGVSVLAGIVLVVDWLQRRAAVRAGSDPEPVRAAPVGGDIDPVTEVFAVLPAGPSSSGGGDGPTTATPFSVESDSQQTMILPAVRPSGSDSRPSGAQPGVTPSGSFLSPSVTSRAVEPGSVDSPDTHDRPSRNVGSEAEQTVVVGVLRPKDVKDAEGVTAGPADAETLVGSHGGTAGASGHGDEVDDATDSTSIDAARADGSTEVHVGPTNGTAAGWTPPGSGAAPADAEDSEDSVDAEARSETEPVRPDAGFVGLVKAGRPDHPVRPDGSDRTDSDEVRPPNGSATVDGSTVTDIPAVRSQGSGPGVDLAKTSTADVASGAPRNGAAVDTPPAADDMDARLGGSTAQPIETSQADDDDESPTARYSGGSAYSSPAMAGLDTGNGSSDVGGAGAVVAAEPAAAVPDEAVGSSNRVASGPDDQSIAGSASTVYDDDDEPPEESANAAAVHIVSELEDEVLVIDERPRYHLAGCRAVLAEAVIPLPAREAVDLGFTPCGWCSPDATLADRHRADVGH